MHMHTTLTHAHTPYKCMHTQAPFCFIRISMYSQLLWGLMREDCKFETSLGYIVSPRLCCVTLSYNRDRKDMGI